MKTITLLLLTVLLSFSALAQYVIPPTAGNIDNLKLKLADDTLIIKPGTRGPLMIKNFKNIVVVGEGVTIVGGTSYSLSIVNCQKIKITGVKPYRFVINGNHNPSQGITGAAQGIKAGGLTSDLEIEFVEVYKTRFSGMMIKTEPDPGDTMTLRPNFVMENVNIHDCYFHHTGGEALYIGHSFFMSENRNHTLKNVRVHHNKITSINSDGIQVGSSSGGAYIYDNFIDSTGINPHKPFQSSGIQVGEGTTGIVERNKIYNAGSNGIIVLGMGDNIIRNNYIENAGTCGIFVINKSGTIPGTNYIVENNAFVNYKEYGARFSSEINNNFLLGNTFISSKPYLDLGNKNVKVMEHGNVYYKY